MSISLYELISNIFNDIYSCQSCLNSIINYSANNVMNYPLYIWSVASSNVTRFVFGKN